jgi:VWFA-related protein
MRLGMLLILGILGFGITSEALAQVKNPPVSDDDDEILSVDTTLIDVPLVVIDKAGKPILNLKSTDFTIYEDGVKQEVADFSTTSAPFEVALLLDTSGSTRGDLKLIQRAAGNFISSLRSGDHVSIVAFKTDIQSGKQAAVSYILANLTNNRAKLNDALAEMKMSNGTPYYDGLLTIAEQIFAAEPAEEFRGRRAIVALTDGVDSTSASDFEEVREQLEKSGVAIYFVKVDTREYFEEELLGDCESSVRFSQAQIRRYYRTFYPKSNVEKVSDFCGLGDFERLDISKNLYALADSEMQKLAKNSGGKVFPATSLNDARAAFSEVAAELGTKYALGYYPKNQKRDGSFRKITVEVTGIPKGSQIRARVGYSAPQN